jgi:hypothetical protein
MGPIRRRGFPLAAIIVEMTRDAIPMVQCFVTAHSGFEASVAYDVSGSWDHKLAARHAPRRCRVSAARQRKACANAQPSTCISRYATPSRVTSNMVGGNAPRTAAEASRMRRMVSSAPGCLLLAIAPMCSRSQTAWRRDQDCEALVRISHAAGQ